MRISQESYIEFRNLVTRSTLIVLIYIFLKPIFKSNKTLLNIIITIFIVSTISQSQMFSSLKNRLNSLLNKNISSNNNNIINSIKPLNPAFPEIKNQEDRLDLLYALKNINLYRSNCRDWNDKKRSLFGTLTWRQQDLVKKCHYLNKINKIDKLIDENYKLLNDLYKFNLKNYEIDSMELKLSNEFFKNSNNYKINSNFRVIESLCHYTRDWSTNGDIEIEPLINYIKTQISKNIKDFDKTTVIVPGSGLGRISHEISKLNKNNNTLRSVHAIEYSWLMYLFNNFIYGNSSSSSISNESNKIYKIHPYIHNYSNHVNVEDQLRSVDLNFSDFKKPENLHLHRCDFTRFELFKNSNNKDKDNNNSNGTIIKDTKEELKDIVIVTAFFIDTAENLIDYFDSINRLCKSLPSKGKKIWINVGPLKYGTAAKVELSYEEIKQLRSLMGWKCIDEIENPEILGYLTDVKGLWQGYYGVTMSTCEFTNQSN
ncbi:hypothetical protein BVG19_g5330 [[Candida] boidinii]|nr:hypothetical protein BVG19_g5330 [[Candida] boidinii]OWB53881.1 hypothetical protein B5S27_g5494 [[Candida] boidinii]OWB85580.1 hypothetical protein B5S33_g4249 [[Candida] boidinii]